MLFFKVRVLKLSAMNVKKYSNFLFFSSHQVIVLNVVDGVEDLPIDFASKIQDSNNSEKGNLNFYVAAELKNIPGNEMSWEFSVGDGKTYGAYRNKELQIGEDYIVYQRAMTYDNDVSNFWQVTICLKLSPKWHCTPITPVILFDWLTSRNRIGKRIEKDPKMQENSTIKD